MTSKNQRIIKGYVWSATTVGLVLGPGADVAPLIALWVAGFVHLASKADLDFDRDEAVAAVATIIAALAAWFVSGKIADFIAAALAAGVLTSAGFTMGVSLVIGAFLALSLNSIINALFTYRFLSVCATLIEDHDASGKIFLKAFINWITDSLLSLAEIPRDLVKTAKLMFSF
jgi:hypothetical protein